MIKLLKRLSVISSVGMAFILLGGALVTKTDSGDGCGKTWPLCHGEFVPSSITPELAIELSHRLVSGIVGVAVLALAIIAWRSIGHVREVKLLSFLSVFFLVLQGLIGAAAVMWGQSDYVLAAHFGISLISFAPVILLMLLIFEVDKKFDATTLVIQKKHRIEIYLLTAFTIFVVYTGALVRHASADFVCSSWPLCHSSDLFEFTRFNTLQWIQMGHRFVAGLLFIWTFIFFIRMIRVYKDQKVMYWGWIITFALIFLQVLFGALIIFTSVNLIIALFHALFISCYFAMLSYFILLSSRSHMN